jgi:heat shock transcription factor
VLDEDEFAKTLIPELFKHNNYASFVRQLNMYGFHKRVGLSDNSMKASERKNKSPSEYYNPYFKRGHPNLLWLINKPKSGNSKKKTSKKEEGDVDSDEDAAVDEVFPAQPISTAAPSGSRGAIAASDVGPLQKRELVQVKSQIDKLQQQQVAISQLIERLRRDHNQLVNQALMFQNMHERHENSINAILNFLANVFRKSLEDPGGAQSVSDLLRSIVPNAQQMPQGSVVDLGDFDQQNTAGSTSVSPLAKRPRGLLPPIPNQSDTSTASTPATQASYTVPQMESISGIFDPSPSELGSPAYLKSELQSNPQQGMMKIIQDTNAGGSAQIDLPDMAAKTPVSMTSEQRNKMLNIMAGQTPTSPGQIPNMPSPASATSPGNPITSLSPILSSMPPPSMYDIHKAQAEIDALQQMQIDQAAKLGELSSMLGPLSPSGRIPGIVDMGNSTAYFDHNVDLDQYLDPNAFVDLNYNPDFNTANPASNLDGTDFDFNLDPLKDAGVPGAGKTATVTNPGHVLDTGSDSNTPSPAATEEIARDDFLSPERDAKRRRRA